jgi:hypothetical protein
VSQKDRPLIRPRLLITLAIVTVVLTLPPILLNWLYFSDVYCIYPGDDGELLKGKGRQCDAPGVIRFEAK